jgi:hypothetical protein
VEYCVSFSEQKPSTDTVAADKDNKPFRNEDGSLLFRPGGHVGTHEGLSLRVHEVSHQEHGYGYRNDTDEPQFPIERENQDDGRQRYQDGTGQVGHLVGKLSMSPPRFIPFN